MGARGTLLSTQGPPQGQGASAAQGEGQRDRPVSRALLSACPTAAHTLPRGRPGPEQGLRAPGTLTEQAEGGGPAPQGPAPPAPREHTRDQMGRTPTSLGPNGSLRGGCAELPGPVHAGRPTGPNEEGPVAAFPASPSPAGPAVVSSPRVGQCGGFQSPWVGNRPGLPPTPFLQSGPSLMLRASSKPGAPLSSPPWWRGLRRPTLVSGMRVVSDPSLSPRPTRHSTSCPRWLRGQAGFSWRASSAGTASGHWSALGAGRPPPGGPCPPRAGGHAPGTGGHPPRAGRPHCPGPAARYS